MLNNSVFILVYIKPSPGNRARLEMENGKGVSVDQASMIQQIWQDVLFTKAQNETILQNQTVLNYKLMAIIDHFNIQLDHDWKLIESKFLKGSYDATDTNFRTFYNDSLERMGVDTSLLKK